MLLSPVQHDLAWLYALPWKLSVFPLPPGSGQWTNLWYAEKPLVGHIEGVVLPNNTKSVRVQIEGTLPGTGYTDRVTSNVVQVNLP